MLRICLLLINGFILANSNIVQHNYGLLPIDNKGGTPQPDMKWIGADFKWPCSTTRALFKSSGKYLNKNNIATRGQIWRDTFFFALPRYKKGVPATLVKTKMKRGSCHTQFEPFPCWSMQEEGKCAAMQNIVDLVIDGNDVLWVLDTGILQTLEDPVQKCPPKVLAFNIRTGKLLKAVHLDGLTTKHSRLQYLAVDYGQDGRAFFYVSDAAARAILVYDVQANRGYRVILPKAVSEGCPKKDVLYLALTRKTCGTTVLYFTYLCSNRMYAIQTDFLRNGRTSGRIDDIGEKPEKFVIIGTDNGCAIFFRYEGKTEVYRWDSNTPFESSSFKVVYRSDTCQLATHAIADYKHSKMRLLESNFPDFIQNKVGCGATQQVSVMTGCW